MNAVQRWLKNMEKIYGGEDEAAVFDRATRMKGDVDRVVIEFAILKELEAIRALLKSLKELV
jgi:hypothetical protein